MRISNGKIIHDGSLMGMVDQFLQAHVQNGLQQGEPVRWMGLLRHPHRLTRGLIELPDGYHEYLGVATDRRLILFATDVAGFNVKALPKAGHAHEWHYDEIASVHSRVAWWPLVHSGGKALSLTLTARPGCGPAADDDSLPGGWYDDSAKPKGSERRYDMYLTIADLDANTQMFHQFPGWLQSAVAQQQFPLPPHKQAQANQRISARKQREAAEAAKTAAALAGAGRVLVKVLLICLMLGSLIGALVIGGFAIEKWQIHTSSAAGRADEVRDVEAAAAKVKAGGVPDCARPTMEYAFEPSSPSQYTCGGCRILNRNYSKEPPPKGWVERASKANGFEVHHCPPPSTYEAAIDRLEDLTVRSAARTRSELIVEALKVVAALVASGVFGWLVFRKKKPAQAQANVSAPTRA